MSRDYPEAAPAIPEAWLSQMSRLPAEGGPTGADWAPRVRSLVVECLDQWQLKVTGPAMTGWTAVVFPVVREDGSAAMLKVGWPHEESVGEHVALRIWDGDGAVRLLAADPARGALLLEQLDSRRTLEAEDVYSETAIETIGGLLRRLHIPPPPNVPRLVPYVEKHVAAAVARPDLPRRFAQRMQSLAGDLLSEADAESVLIHGDLHFANVLAGEREPWLAIDPKPMAGHPGFEIQAVLRNRDDELGTGSALRWSIRRRLEVLCDAMGLDVEVGRLWAILHTGIEIGWALKDGDADATSLHVSIFKALED